MGSLFCHILLILVYVISVMKTEGMFSSLFFPQIRKVPEIHMLGCNINFSASPNEFVILKL